MDDNYKTPLIVSAVEMAARNLDLPESAIFHSDRGSNYASGDFAKALKRLEIRQSVGRIWICYDNALPESFNGISRTSLSTAPFTRPGKGPDHPRELRRP
jgi:putative transposase